MLSSKDVKKVRGCHNPEMRKLILGAMKAGFRYRMTRGGVIIHGDNGESASIHFTESDHRAVKNATSLLRKIGYGTDGK